MKSAEITTGVLRTPTSGEREPEARLIAFLASITGRSHGYFDWSLLFRVVDGEEGLWGVHTLAVYVISLYPRRAAFHW